MVSHPLIRLLIFILLAILGMGLFNRVVQPHKITLNGSLPNGSLPNGSSLGAMPSTAPLTNSMAQFGAEAQANGQWPAPTLSTQPNLKVAFIGDTGDDQSFTQIMQLIRQEDAQLVLHQGDFSYANGPTADWLAAIDQLDAATPYLGADGNHDQWAQYAPFFEAQLQKTGVRLHSGSVASGSYAATYEGLLMVMNQQGGDTDFNQAVLAQSAHIWKVCSWHHNRHDFQAGGKNDAVALATYQSCVNGGAIIATGHEHSYSRSYSLSDLSAPHYGAFGDPAQMQIAVGNPGRSFFFVNGLGGRSLRDYHALAHDDDGWWATIYTSNRYCTQSCTAADFSGQNKRQDIPSYEYTFGVLFIEFHIEENPYKARGYFKTIDGDVVDTFLIEVNAQK